MTAEGMPVTGEFGNDAELNLVKAILLYESRGYDRLHFATLHDIVRKQNTAPEIGPAELLARETLEEIVSKLTGADPKRELIAPNVLSFDSGRMAWWSPAQRRPIYFSTADKAFNKAVNGKEALHPPLVFIVEPGKLCAFALGANERPSAKTKLFTAPYCNLYDKGDMCRGNIPLPNSMMLADIPQWERAFYDTQFTHTNLRTGKMTRHPKGHNGLWRDLSRRGVGQFKYFPYQHLLRTKKTLIEVINQ